MPDRIRTHVRNWDEVRQTLDAINRVLQALQMSDMSDVSRDDAPAAKYMLVYDVTTGKWQPVLLGDSSNAISAPNVYYNHTARGASWEWAPGDPPTAIDLAFDYLADAVVLVTGEHAMTASFVSELITGTAPFVVASTTLCTNLNADLLDGSHADAFAPARPLSLAGATLADDVSMYNGKASDGAGQYFRSAAGEDIDGTYTGGKIVLTDTIVFTTPTSGDPESGGDDTFREGATGTLSARITKEGAEAEQGTRDLGAGLGSNLSLEVTHQVGSYNGFAPWLRGGAKISSSGYLGQGYNKIVMRHLVSGSPRDTADMEIFYDDSASVATFDTAPAIAELSKVSKWLSGIEMYGVGSTFNITQCAISDLFKNTYLATTAVYVSWRNGSGNGSSFGLPGEYIAVDAADSAWNGTVSSPPDISDVATLGGATKESLTASTADRCGRETKIRIAAAKPGRSIVYGYESLSGHRLINTFGTKATFTAIERFLDENYRLPSGFDFDSKTDAASGQWTPGDALANGNAQCELDDTDDDAYMGSLIYPQYDYTSGTWAPTQTRDYSAFSGDQAYYRAFEHANGSPRFSMVIRIYCNLSTSDLGVFGVDDTLSVAFKLPDVAPTGAADWLDAIDTYSFGDDMDDDGDGARDENYRTGQSGTSAYIDIPVTFGGHTTGDSSDRIYVRIEFQAAGAPSAGAKGHRIWQLQIRDKAGAGSTGGLWT